MIGQHLVKFVYSEKASKLEEMFLLVLTLISKVKTKRENYLKFCGLFTRNLFFRQLASQNNLGKKQVENHQITCCISAISYYEYQDFIILIFFISYGVWCTGMLQNKFFMYLERTFQSENCCKPVISKAQNFIMLRVFLHWIF